MSRYDNNATRAREVWVERRTDEIMEALQGAHDFYGKHLEPLRAIAAAEADLESEDADLANAADRAHAHKYRSAA